MSPTSGSGGNLTVKDAEDLADFLMHDISNNNKYGEDSGNDVKDKCLKKHQLDTIVSFME